VTVEEVAGWIDEGQTFRLIDVREPWEREIVSLPTAEPLDERLVERLLRSGELDQRLVFMCHHGIRSLNAAAFFAAQGFNHVYSMSGGIAAWAERIDPALPQY
jgi:monothiol glutaredoxin